MTTKKSKEISKIFLCESCDYSTCKNSEFKKHLLTNKHINTTKYNTLGILLEKEYICHCGKEYNHRASLFNHKKRCKQNQDASISGASISGASISGASISGASVTDASNNVIQLLINENKELINENKEFKNENKEIKNMILELVKSNNDLQKQMIDVCLKIQPGNTVINSNSHNNNKTFNLQLFLNEECKDAMNMSEFINSIEIKVSDLENMGKIGYVEGMSNIIIKQLNDTDINKRPVHCSDAKRETLYIKEENKWEKDTQETKQMFKAVRGVDKKNYKILANWKDTHPKCMESKSNQSDEYMKVVSKVMDGDEENVNKVIKKVAKQVLIDK
jgi:hypothetical protein